jgi:hypothetical protein
MRRPDLALRARGKIAQRRTIMIAVPGNLARPARSGVGSAQEEANGDNIAAPFLGSGGNMRQYQASIHAATCWASSSRIFTGS